MASSSSLLTWRAKYSQDLHLEYSFNMTSTQQFTLLIVDDDPMIHQSLKLIAPKYWKIYSAFDLDQIQTHRHYHAAFVDMHLTNDLAKFEGLSALKKLSESSPQIELIAMSGDLSRELMEKCLQVGAQRFIAKPLHPEEIQLILEKIEALWNLRNISTGSPKKVRLVGSAPASENIRSQIASLKGEKKAVLIEGETGTGKEVVAHLLHQQEGVRPLIAVNLANIPDNLFESEMFGHLKGAFTGADSNKIGLIEAAHGGDLFLDEIEALPLQQQAKLLRFLETGEIRKVGAKENIIVETRVIAATNRNLEDMVSKGEFREDLLYRIKGQKILLPPLRNRKEDIPDLAQHFLALERPQRNKSFTPDALEALTAYPWPGNIRELRRICEQLTLTSPLPIIRAEDVRNLIHPMSSSDSVQKNTVIDLKKGLNTLISEFECQVIKLALEETKDIEQAAQVLKISRSNLYKKIKEYSIEED